MDYELKEATKEDQQTEKADDKDNKTDKKDATEKLTVMEISAEVNPIKDGADV